MPEVGRPLPEAARRRLAGRAELRALLGYARAEAVTLYLAGGAVRDLLLGLETCDLDLVSAAPLSFARRFATDCGLPFVMLDEEHGVARVAAPGLDLDFSLFRAPGATPEEQIRADLLERDFTVNSMAVPLEAVVAGRLSPLIDPAGGLADLEARRLRATSAHSLAADPLRSLRLWRLAAQFGLQIEPATRRAALAQAQGLARVAGERLRAELVKMLAAPCASHLRDMAEGGLLGAVLPALEQMRGVAQRGYHHLDVLAHSLATVEQLEAVAAEPARYFPCPEELTPENLQATPLWLLKLAALLHDAGKPATAAEARGHVSFHRHEERGAQVAKAAALRLRLSRAETATLARLVGLHMRPFHLVRLLRLGGLSERAVRRMIDAARTELPGLFLIAMADSLAASGPEKPEDAERLLAELCCEAARYLREKLRPMRERPRLVTGRDLIEAFGLEPGPQVGELLQAIEDARLEGELETRQEALELAARLLKEP